MDRIAQAAQRIQGEAAYAVLAEACALEAQGKDIIHLEIGQPDFISPAQIIEAGIAALTQGKTGYAPTLGVPELRAAIAARECAKGRAFVASGHVAVMPSAKTGIFIALAALVDPGDEVVIPDPGFPAYRNVVEYLGATPIPLPILEERDFSFDKDTFASLVSKKTKVVVLNSPSNPTGGVLTKDDLSFVAELAQRYDFWVLSDDIYDELVFGEPVAHIANEPHMQDRLIILNGFSKTYAMAGWRLGYLVVPQKLMPVIENLSVNLFACTATFTQYAGIAALGLADEVRSMRDAYQVRRDYLVQALNEIPGVTCKMPRGAFYVFPNVESYGVPAATIARHILEDGGVALLPGTAFGVYGEGHLRLSYATAQPLLEEGVRRIKASLGRMRV